VKTFVTDEPIKNDQDDTLDRGKFVNHLVESICNWDGKESLAIGLYGAWGNGKTSLINLVRSKLKRIDNELKIIDFCPWMLSESDNLVESFMEELSKAIGKKRRLLRKYANLLTQFTNKENGKSIWDGVFFVATLIGATTTGVLPFISNVSSFLKWGAPIFTLVSLIANKISPYFSKPQSIVDTKKEITKLLKKNEKKLLIVIDDIDRLSTQEIRQIFRIIRTNADFPKVMYFLAFDRNVVEKSLVIQEGISGQKYLEKMIQVSFILPAVSKTKVFDYLINELNKICKDFPALADFFEDAAYARQIYHPGFQSFFTNLRDVKRFLNSLKFNMTMLLNEDTINPIDFMAIEAFRLFEPDFYGFLLANKSLFTEKTPVPNLWATSKDITDETNVTTQLRQEGYDLLNSNSRTQKIDLLGVLFPQITGMNPGIKESVMNHRICQPENFDAYFTLTLQNGGEITKYDIEKFFTESIGYDSLVSVINEFQEQNRYLSLINMLYNFIGDPKYFRKENYANIIRALLDSFDNIEIVRWFMPFSSIDYRIVLLIHAFLTKDVDLEYNYTILSEVVSASKSLCGIVFYFAIEIDEFEKEERSAWEQLLSDSAIIELKSLCVNKIRDNQSKIVDEKMAPLILFQWKKWSDGSDYNKFISNLLDNESDFLKFFDQFAYSAYGAGFNFKNPNVFKLARFNYKDLKDFYDLDEVKQRIEKIKTNPILYEQHKPVIDLFLDNYDHRNNLV
jgi:predicted KAP-like P-loop ATPase